MSMRVLIHDYPHRTVALATDEHVLIFRHTHTPPENARSSSSSSLPLSLNSARPNTTPRCMVEFAERSSIDLNHFHSVTTAKGTLGLITLNNDVFLCVITGSEEVASVRRGETVQKIYAVEFYCLNRADYDHAHGPYPNPYPGQSFQSDDVDYGGGYDQGDSTAEHPFHALKKLLSNGHFYYSLDFDLTRRLQDRAEVDSAIDISSLDEGLLWNSYMIDPLLKFRSRLADHERFALDHSRLLTSVIRGFVKSLPVPPSSSPIRGTAPGLPATLTVISRLSSRRAGTRFNSRGVDDNGNVANFVETETIFWSPAGLCFSYTQIRGSIPIFWESSSSLIPGQQKIQITRSPEATQPAFDKHFSMLERTYGAVHIVNLLSAFKPGEVELTERYRQHVTRSPLRRDAEGEEEEHHLLRETEFDFHERTKGATGYEGARAIRPYLDSSAESFVYFLAEEVSEETVVHGKRSTVKRPVVIMQQNGVFRVNCLDCLDRTNLIQGMISQMALELFLSHRDERGNSDVWMRHSALWADNGDTLSKIYAGTGALKSSFTRHGKMSLAGAIADARKSATRLYVNHFEDKNRQNTVDLLLGRLVGQNSVDLFDPINDWVVAEVGRRRAEFETRDTIKLGVGTFNLNGRISGAKEDLSPWLAARERGLDVVVVGFQEIVELSPQQIMSTDPNRRMMWERTVRDCLNWGDTPDDEDEKCMSEMGSSRAKGDDYVLLRSGQLVGAALLVFVRSSVLPRIKNVEGALKKTGMSGIAGNKGAVAIRMDIESTSVCFVTAHLAAGFANYEERNRDYQTITAGLRFQRNRSIEDHEIVVWAGDFNYRIGLGYEKVKALVNEAMIGNEKVREDALGRLYENDQLNIQMVVGSCFNFYREGRVKFLPTYKYDIGRDEFDSSDKQRIPAWTDRILWKVNHKGQHFVQGGEVLGTQMKQLEYDSVMSLRFSDHRPVYAVFEMGILVVDEQKKDDLTRRLYSKRAKEMKAKGAGAGAGAGAGDSTEGLSISDTLDGSDDDEMESLSGYASIQEGLPPASSDKRKWWLDGNKTARSTLRAPQDGMMLNKDRPANPWKEKEGEGGDDDWVKVEKPQQKPTPPPSRGTGTRRMVPPPWEGGRVASSSSSLGSATKQLEVEKTRRPPALPPPTPTRRGVSATRSRAATSSATSSPARSATSGRDSPQIQIPMRSSSTATATATKKQPPAKPVKPSILTTSSSQTAVPQVRVSPLPAPVPVLPRLASRSRQDGVVSPLLEQATKLRGERDRDREGEGEGEREREREREKERPPPPLPKRTGTMSSTASFVSAPDIVGSASPTATNTSANGSQKGGATATLPARMTTTMTPLQQYQQRIREGSGGGPLSFDNTRSSSGGGVLSSSSSSSPPLASSGSRNEAAAAETTGPPLPPRRQSERGNGSGSAAVAAAAAAVGGLMDQDVDDTNTKARGGLNDRYKPLMPG
ncbi:Inositol-1,4,5-trisphosphate 5-phosphatase 1 [Exophiala xenobiotica]|nr:Inositol-1,4,5-trisphosphate 5-phosphatase 1 [Exophiala xenobiotica]KAK5253948.1 Inositol-1,4,5-trisphosphate 5-phosphatase 1 [Exophiala xenobiotica]KAK5330419.1 Inositol-1,4,5-trisphosphate 5-phosphatase 1 [Exophiala xenobiotica]KAK5353532.1 Inositol-1,4,5-trisphosphate 5-phosphatase 1 [Exophiala xenobiotica]KAK5383228.1 Inositol-1,4,5-trisphosphate 5-phosphatase 1 [Exophiala xenobiotica]